jgi:hypothetical protein
LEITKKASAVVAEGKGALKKKCPPIAVLVGPGYRPKQWCPNLLVAPGRYFAWKRGPVSQAELRRQWLRQIIAQAHGALRGT